MPRRRSRHQQAAAAAATTVAVVATVAASMAIVQRPPVCESKSVSASFGVGRSRDRAALPWTSSSSEALEDWSAAKSTTTSRVLLSTLRGGGERSAADDDDDDEQRKKPTSQRRRRSPASQSKRSSPKDTKAANNKATDHTLPIVDEILKETDFYKILGTTKQDVLKASKPDTVIQKAYRKRAVQTHPDKTGGDRRAFDKVAEAYDVLQDGSKRKLYDRYGKRGVEGAAGGGGGGGAGGATAGMSGMRAEDLFQNFFGGGAGSSPFASFGQQYYQQQRNRSVRYELEVTLEDLYRGKSLTVTLPGRNGKSVPIAIPRGAHHNQEITASGVMDSDSTQPPGDALFRIKQQPHATFTRKGYDLAVPMEISLAEAIAGVARTIQHLDGRTLTIVSAAAGIESSSNITDTNDHACPAMISTGDVHVLKGEGMPKDDLGTEVGDLYVQFQVALPKPPTATSSGSFGTKKRAGTEGLTQEERRELERLLRKLEGKTSSSHQHWPFTNAKGVKRLELASASDFGRSSTMGGQQQQSSQNDHHSSSPFEGFNQDQSNQRFYWSSSFSGNSFFESPGANNNEDLSQPECRQM